MKRSSLSTIEKLKKRLYSSPIPKDMTIQDLTKLANHYGCIIRTGGNHQIAFVNLKTGKVIPVPHYGKSIKPAYIKELQELFGDEEYEGK